MTYAAQYFHAFSHLDKVETAGRRVERFAEVSLSVWEMRHSYEGRMSTVYPYSYGANIQLLDNIEKVRTQWAAAKFDGTYSDAKKQSEEFNNYKRTEKRKYYAEKTDLESLLGNIQTKVKTYALRAYSPPRGLQLSDLDSAWRTLTKSEGQHSKIINGKIGAYGAACNSLIIGLRKVYGGRLQRRQMNSPFFWTQSLCRLPSLKVRWRTSMTKSAKSRMDFRQFKPF